MTKERLIKATYNVVSSIIGNEYLYEYFVME